MLKNREDCWPEDVEHPSERYLYIGIRDEARILITAEGIYADDAEITFRTEEGLKEWIYILRKAWRIKIKQDKKGWGTQFGIE